MRALSLVLLLGLACAAPGLPGGSQLRPESELVPNCFGWPDEPFTRQNHADVGARLATGAAAVDFTLQDVNGKPVHLADLLADQPVLLVEGSWTCPRFQSERAGLDALARKYAGQVQVVLAYTVEAHPAEAASPYRGRPWPQEFSDRGQAATYDERLASAKQVAQGAAMKVVVDDLRPGRANPIWCTYGTCASCSWLIGRDGTIAANHEWHDNPSMETSIDALLAAPH
jgi:hypothetical protein